jgi:Single-strand binding protein family
MPDPQPQAPHQPSRHPSRACSAALIQSGRLRWLHRLPLVLSRHASVSTVPWFQGQGRPPGQTVQEGSSMTEATVSFAGNLTDDPELRHTESGIARAMFRVAVSGRREQEPSFFTAIVWRDQAEHAAQSLSKGSRVVVVGSSSSGLGPLRMAAPGRSSRLWPRSWVRACGGRPPRRPGSPSAAASNVSCGCQTHPPIKHDPQPGRGELPVRGRGHRPQRRRPAPRQGDPKVLGPPLLLVSFCFPQSRHSRYQPPWGLRRRCQRWSRTLHRQGLAIVASLGIGHTGSMRRPYVQTRESTPAGPSRLPRP